MRRSRHIIPLLMALLVLVGCSGSKSYSKKGEKLDEAGLYAEAAEMFLQAARRNAKNVDAKIGLKKTGQMVVNDELSNFFKQVAMGGSRADAVSTYLRAQDYLAKVRTAGVMLEIPDHYKADFEKVKGEHLVDLYTQGQAFIEKEEFGAAERVFAQIAKLEPNYKDANSLQDLAYLEPLYRNGKTEFDAGNFRKAYANFDKVVTRSSTYKDANALRLESISKGQYVVAVLPFTASEKMGAGVAAKVQAHAMTALTETRDPFLKVVDRENLERILEEQRLSMSGVVDEQTAVRVGNLIGAHAVLMGTVVDYRELPGSLKRSTKDAFEAYRVQQINDKGEKVFVTRYKPVRYSEYFQENKVVLSFNYRLVSLETGEVLVSKVAEKEASDHAYYATYDGNKDALFPMGKGAADLSDRGRRDLRALLSAPQDIKPVANLLNDVLRTTSSSMASTILQDLSAKLP